MVSVFLLGRTQAELAVTALRCIALRWLVWLSSFAALWSAWRCTASIHDSLFDTSQHTLITSNPRSHTPSQLHSAFPILPFSSQRRRLFAGIEQAYLLLIVARRSDHTCIDNPLLRLQRPDTHCPSIHRFDYAQFGSARSRTQGHGRSVRCIRSSIFPFCIAHSLSPIPDLSSLHSFATSSLPIDILASLLVLVLGKLLHTANVQLIPPSACRAASRLVGSRHLAPCRRCLFPIRSRSKRLP